MQNVPDDPADASCLIQRKHPLHKDHYKEFFHRQDTEENINGILDYCVRAGVKGIICFGMGVTMRDGNREYFYKALDEHFPGLKKRYIRTYGNAYELPSPHNDRLMEIFTDVCRENGIMYKAEDCFSYLHEYQDKYEQMTFLDLI